MTCEHQYIVTLIKKTETSEAAQEIMCPKCMHIVDMGDIIEAKSEKAKNKRLKAVDLETLTSV